jgi:hypothetical protein
MEANPIEGLLQKIEVCDKALARLAFVAADTTTVERAIRDVRADAVARLRAHGYTISADER